MKTTIIKSVLFSLLIVVSISLQAQIFNRDDENNNNASRSNTERGIGDVDERALPTPPDDPSGGGNQPVGGPVGEGLLLLLGMGALYGVRKLRRCEK